MARSPKTLKIRIPPYVHPRYSWRQQVHEAVRERQLSSPVTYKEGEKLEVELVLYLSDLQISFHDVDNRLKDVLDALQGRAGGAARSLRPIISNDNQIFRVVVEKKIAPPQSHRKGHLTVRRLSNWRLVRKPRLRRMPARVGRVIDPTAPG
jgi:Holliday junction resolvase RusA-like endonuclease